jgi:hypothetical protein
MNPTEFLCSVAGAAEPVAVGRRSVPWAAPRGMCRFRGRRATLSFTQASPGKRLAWALLRRPAATPPAVGATAGCFG